MSDKVDKETKRKRRRRAGLRVPSDNVPRSKSQSDVAAPAPEDPRLAVSVAYAFSNGSSAAALEDEAGVRDTIRNVAGPDSEDGKPYSSDHTIELDAVEDLDSVEDLSAYDEDLTEASSEHPALDDEVREADGEMTEIEPAPDPGDTLASPPPRGDGVPKRVETVHDASGMASAGEARAPSHAERTAGGDSVDIAFEDEDEIETAPSADAPEAKEPPPAARDDAGAGEPEPASAPAGKAKFVRARTVALTDQDLEELMEDYPSVETESDARATVKVEPVAAESDEDEEDEPEETSAVVEPQDPSDSGEIIADDMIEEIDDKALARAVPLQSEEAAEEVSEPPPPPPVAKGKKPKPPPAPAIEPPRRRGKSKAKPWFEEVFDENYLRTLPFLTPQATEAEANFVIESLGLDPGAEILDVGCGYGRHSMELAARGYGMHGLDLSLPLLMRGADEAQRRGLDINFVHGDMREMQFDSEFDGAFCLFATFGYFDDETNKKTAQQIARALKPGARLVLEVLNRDYLIRDLPTRVWWEGDGCVILEEVDFNYFSSRIVSTRSIAFDDGRQLEQEISIRAFSLHELGKLLHAAGFRVVEISGSMVTRGRFFGTQSRDIIVVAEKRAKGNGGK